MLALRPYQQEALDAIKADFRKQPNVLLQAATGAGKTILFSALIRDFMTQYPGQMHIMIAAHRQTLVQQAYDKLLRVWPEGESQIGIACHSLSSKSDFSKPVTIGTIQTIARQLNNLELGTFNLLIIDEVHMVPPMAERGKPKSQYEQTIELLRKFDPKARVLGVTATPYRLNWGYIYGDKRTQDPKRNWFTSLAYSIDIPTLQEEDFLCPLIHLGKEHRIDLSRVEISSTGDYKEDALSVEMSKEIHLDSAVKAVKEYAADREHIVVFAVTIQHAELLTGRFTKAGYKAAFVHSKMKKEEVNKELAAFADGRVNVLVNVGKLTEGWDCPQTDCIVLCRPTKSAALYVQMVGRGLRIAEGKADCKMLDLAGCMSEHGMPENPTVKNKPPKESDYLECPKCGTENAVGAMQCSNPDCGWLFHWVSCPRCEEKLPADAKKCGYCGYALPQEAVAVPGGYACPDCQELVAPSDIFCGSCGCALKPIAKEVRLQVIEPKQQIRAKVRAKRVSTPNVNFNFVSRAGKKMARVAFVCQFEEGGFPIQVSDFWDLEGSASDYGRTVARKKWMQLARTMPPKTLEEAARRQSELHFPAEVTVKQSGQYWNVVGY